jgi:hypothetical protein
MANSDILTILDVCQVPPKLGKSFCLVGSPYLWQVSLNAGRFYITFVISAKFPSQLNPVASSILTSLAGSPEPARLPPVEPANGNRHF